MSFCQFTRMSSTHEGQCDQLLPCLHYIHVPLFFNKSSMNVEWHSWAKKGGIVLGWSDLDVSCWNSSPVTPGPALCFVILQGEGDFENSDTGWGAAHTQECRWVDRGPDTHACEVSFHPLAGIQWGGRHQTNEGATWLPPGQRHALPYS